MILYTDSLNIIRTKEKLIICLIKTTVKKHIDEEFKGVLSYVIGYKVGSSLAGVYTTAKTSM